MNDKAIDCPNYIKHSQRNKSIEEDAHAVKSNEYLVIGAYFFKYIGTRVQGYNCDFTYSKEEMEGLKVCVENSKGKIYIITLTYEEGECGSGWCTSLYGYWNIAPCNKEEVSKCTLEPLDWEGAYINLLKRDRKEINNHLFSCSYYSEENDGYYPSGGWSIHKDAWVDIHKKEESISRA